MKNAQSCIMTLIFFLISATASAQVTFTDVTNPAGLGSFPSGGMATWGDYDNDGDADVLAASKRRLYRNEGDGTFRDVSEAVGITTGTAYGLTFLDFDNDGDLDLFMVDFGIGDVLYRNEGDGAFVDISQTAGMGSTVRQADGVVSFDYDNDGLLDIFVTSSATGVSPNLFYYNEGNGSFREMAAQLGLDKPEHSGGVALGDYDDDGDLDIFITIFSYPEPDKQELVLYRNDGGRAFVDVSQEAGLQGKNSPSDAFFWDYDNDGDLDLFVQSVQTFDEDDINILYRNNGDSTFTDATSSAGLALENYSASGAGYGDYDNDGWLDLCVTYDALPIHLYHNNRDGTFTDMSRAAGVTGPSSGATSFVDYDNDGDLDIFIATWIVGPGAFYRNDGAPNHWLQLRLVGQQSNRDAIGARVKVMAGELEMLREVAGSSAIGSMQDRLPIHFGLGDNSQADVIEIRWPSGIVQTLTDIPVDQRLTIDEMEGIQIVLYSVFPDAGDPTGGTSVQIRGENFLPGSRVLFGGVEADSVIVFPPSLITTVTPPGIKGSADVEVVHPDGKSGVLRDGFLYTSLKVTGITPESGPATGGTTVQIQGFGFQTGAQVYIGENPLTDIFVMPTMIRGTIPPGDPGIVDVSVINPDGGRDILNHAFTYTPPPTIRSVTRFVPLGGGREIRISGSGFIATPRVQIGGFSCNMVDFISPALLEATTPAMIEIGLQEVVVINPDGQRAILTDAVEIIAPIEIKSVEPTSGGLEGGTKITIVGEPIVAFKSLYGTEREYPSRFVGSVEVFVGGEKATDVIIQSDNVITAVTPPNTPGLKDVEVTNGDEKSDTLKDAFTYNVLPQIARIIPDNGRLAGGTEVTVQGSSFLPGAKVFIIAESGTYLPASSSQVVSSAIITAITPAGKPGAKDVVVRNPDKQETILPEGFTYNPLPTITSITPNNGLSSGRTKVIVEGTGFLLGARVMIGERSGTTMVKDDMTIEAVTPPNPPGLWDVRVVNPDTQEAVMREGFVTVGELAYNFPNPFQASRGTTFRYVTDDPVQYINVKVFNLAGIPIDVIQQSGSNEVEWHNPDVHGGLYIYLMEVRLEDGSLRQFKNTLEVYE